MIMERPDLDELDLIDPVCGINVNMLTPHICIHGGAKFYFCGKECLSLFRANPEHFVVLITPEPRINVVESGAETRGISEEQNNTDVNSTSPFQSERKPERQNVIRWLRCYITSWRQARKVHRHLVTTCKELLALYFKISAEHPELGNRQLLKLLVMARINCGENIAYDVLKFADESYASWPEERELTMHDVIHYLTVTELTSKYDVEHLAQIDFRSELSSLIPRYLHRAKKKEPYLSERRKTLRDRST
ncbi:YHS domain protein [mine drainage metagenome]|uniref:YHS domain protein n=1 Tax=mine drainage metagenome TaxID=410659 RepID=A0A1J5S1U8_9ZZZZ